MRQPTRRAITRWTAALLALLVLWLAPGSSLGTMPSSHPCAMAPASGGVVSSIAARGSASCQHVEQLGCPTGACGVSAVVGYDRVFTAGAALVVAFEIPAVSAPPAGPQSAPPTPPPNA